jgi:pimeloyl-ACP methyl ester carboxylesterase
MKPSRGGDWAGSDSRRSVDESSVLLDGPWTHRFVSANGTRLHVVEAGTGPLVLFLHGFPEFWYAWHHQLPELADAGFRAVAVDLRGCGASDKPPRGYDGYTMAGDVAGLIRALGERSAILVGAGYGGMVAWTTACFHPRLVRRLAVVGAPHPLRLRAALVTDPRGQLAATLPLLRFQVPRYEHLLTRYDAEMVGELLARWGGPSWVNSRAFMEYARACRKAMLIPQAAFCAMESYRWAARSVLRLQGYRFVKLMQRPIVTPTLQLHGARDTAVLPRTAQGSGRYVIARYEWRLLSDTGHFPHQELPEVVTGEILRWAKEA